MSEPALSRGEEVNLLAWILKRSQTHDVGRYLGLKRYPKGWNYARLFVSVSNLAILQRLSDGTIVDYGHLSGAAAQRRRLGSACCPSFSQAHGKCQRIRCAHLPTQPHYSDKKRLNKSSWCE